MPGQPRGKQIQAVESGFPDVSIVLFANRPHWHIRIYDRTKQNYVYRVTNTADIETAKRVLPEIYTTYLANPNLNSQEEKYSTIELVEQWVAYQEQRVKSNQITPNTFKAKTSVMRNALMNYLIEYNLLRATDLNPKKDFQRYVNFCLMTKRKLSTIKKDVVTIKEWITWLYEKGYVKNSTVVCEIPRQTQAAKHADEKPRAFTKEQVALINETFDKLIENASASQGAN